MAERFEISLDVSGTAGAVAAERAVGQLTERISVSRREVGHLARLLSAELSPALGGVASNAVFLSTAFGGIVTPAGAVVAALAGIATISGLVITRMNEAREASLAFKSAMRGGEPGSFLAEIEKGAQAEERFKSSLWARLTGPGLKEISANTERARTGFDLLNKAIAAREGIDAQLELVAIQRKLADATQTRVVGIDAVTVATAAQIVAIQKELDLKKEKVRLDIEEKAGKLDVKGLAGAAQAVRNVGGVRLQALEGGAGVEIEALRQQMRLKITETRKLEAEDLVQQVETMNTREDARRQHALKLLDIEEQFTGDVIGAQRRRTQLEEQGTQAEMQALHRATRARLDALDTRAEVASNEQLRQIFYERARLMQDAATKEEQIAQQAAQRRAQRAVDEKQARDQARGVGEGLLGSAAAALEAQGFNTFDLGDLQATIKEQQARGKATRSELLTGGAVSGNELRNMFEAAGSQRALEGVGGRLESVLQRGAGGQSVSESWGRAAEASRAAWGQGLDALLADTNSLFDKLDATVNERGSAVAKRIFDFTVNGVARQIELEDRRF